MASLFDLLDSATQGLDIQSALGDQAGQFLSIADTARQLIDAPPGEAGGYLGQLQNLALPNLNFGGDLAGVFDQLAPALQGQLGGLTGPVSSAMQGLQRHSEGELVKSLAPLLLAIANLNTLLNSDWSGGLIDTTVAPMPAPLPPAPGVPVALPAPPATPAVVSAAQVTAVKDLINDLPADMTVKSLLIWLHGRVGTSRVDRAYVRAVPVLDDLRDPLDSLVRWNGLDGTQLAQELAQSLGTVADVIAQHTTGVLSAPFTAFQTRIAALPATALHSPADELATALADLQQAVSDKNLTQVATHLATAQAAVTQIDVVNTTLDGQADELAALEAALQAVPAMLHTRMGRLLLLLSPRATWSDLSAHLGSAPVVVSDQTFAPLTQLCQRTQEFFVNLLDVVDVSTAMTPVINTVDQVKQGAEDLEQALVQLTSTAHAQFAQAQSTLSGLGLTTVTQQANEAMDAAIHQIQQTLGQGLQPATDALQQAVTAVDTALNSFDPEQLTQPIQDTLDAIKQVFVDPQVTQALEQLKQLKLLATKLDQLSFTPVADEVITGIDVIKMALSAIDGAKLVSPMPDLIKEAMSVLPPSVKPLTDPLITELGEMIDQGPVPLLAELKNLPKPLFDQIRALEPKKLLGDELSKPFDELRAQLAQFQPEQWLGVIEHELDALRERIRQSASPKGALQPLATSFDAFRGQLDQFKPGDLLDPINLQLHALLSQLDGILPTLDFIQDLQALLARIESLSQLLAQGVDVAQHVVAKLALLTDPSAQLDDWLDEIFGKLVDATALQAPLTAIEHAVAAAHAVPMAASWTSAKAPLSSLLTQADARALHTRIVSRRNAITSALVQALPSSTAKTDLQNWLASFSPAAPSFARGFLTFARLDNALQTASDGVSQAFVQWDARYVQTGGALASIVRPNASVDEIRGWVRQALDRQLGQPVVSFLKQLSALGRMLSTFTDGMDAISQALVTKLATVMAAPQKLIETYAAFQHLLTRLSQLDLHALQVDVEALYKSLLDQVLVLDPRALDKQLNDKFEDLLATLSVSSVITPALRQSLNSTYQNVVKKVDTLDPQLLLVEPMQKLYEDDILPLLDVFDISETVDLLVTFLSALDDQLATEMDRVDTAYQAMLAAAPSSNAGSASVGVSI